MLTYKSDGFVQYALSELANSGILAVTAAIIYYYSRTWFVPRNHVWEGVATLVGTIIGAGILGIPFIVQQSGVWTGLLVIVVLGLAVLVLNLMLGEIVLRTKGNHQLTGYAEQYLGCWGKWWMTLSMVVGIYGALFAYSIGEGETLAQLFGGTPAVWRWVFLGVMALIVYGGIKAIEKSEAWLTPLKILLFVVVCGAAVFSSRFSVGNLTGFSLRSILIPYGVILFSFIGTAAIPEVREETRGNWKDLRKILVIGSLIPLAVYAIFALVVIGTMGASTSEIASIGLGHALGNWALVVINLFAVIAMLTSFIALALALQEMYHYDYGELRHVAWAVTMLVPMLYLLTEKTGFVSVLGITGAVAGGVDGVLIVLMHWRAKKHGDRRPEYSLPSSLPLSLVLIGIFLLGAVHAVFW